ncbi:MAG: FAD-dependent oxidoreductase [Gammaproteobacteria bacterium]|nr:FAD-dependent oxidoreductase [Gammaproteobacteria bacterium]
MAATDTAPTVSTSTTTASCWVETGPPAEEGRAPLAGDASADTVVIGGGIVGLTAALMLQRAGNSVVLLEASRIGRQVTGGSTAKITSQHGLIYHHLTQRFGADAAAAYAQSNEAGLRWIAEQIRERNIDCDYEPRSAYTYALSDEQAAAVEREVEAATRAGLPARLVRETALPFPVRAAVCFDGQAQFHPVKYQAALAAEFVERGGRLHESTRVVDVEGARPCTVVTAEGRVRADDVIVATNIPILDRGGYFGRAFPYRHLCIAGPVDRERAPEGMFISADQPTRSIRSAPWSETERLLVLIGEAFPTGHADTEDKLRTLTAYAGEHFGLTEPRFRWGNQDFYSADRVPYVGPILPGGSRIRVATGFSAWGITTGTVAAMILSDDVLGRRNDWATLYDSRRLGLKGGGMKLVGKNLHVARSWIGQRLHTPPEKAAASLRPGEAALIRLKGKPAAAYRDEGGVLHALDARCTHMGCHVHWNAAERSWDCPCHGSRFDTDGSILHGPAVRALARISE